MEKQKTLEKIGSSMFNLILKNSQKSFFGGNSTPVADSSTCTPWSGNIPGWKFFQEDLDKDGKIIAWGNNIAIKEPKWV